MAAAAALELCEGGRYDDAEQLVGSAADRISSPMIRADLLVPVVERGLGAGRQPTVVVPAYAALLEAADEECARGELKRAAGTFTHAIKLATHRVLHFDSLTSPLADDPAGFTAPLRESAVAAAMRAPRGRVATGGVSTGSTSRGVSTGYSDRDGSSGRGRPVRLLVATRINADFLKEIREYFGGHEGFEMRFMDFAEVHELDRFAKNPDKIVFQTLAAKPGLPGVAEEAFREHLEWADVAFVEWCTALAALLTQVDPGDTRVVVRMHSYEAFTLWPHLMDFSRVDDMVFVSEHLRDLAVAAVPGLQQEDAPRLHVIANAMELQRFVRPKTSDETRFTLGVIGASKMVKDPRWAIEVLRELRRHDERYRLLLVRGKLQDPTLAAQEYAADFQRDLDELEATGAVQVLCHTDDVPSALEAIGVVLSSSVRESFHMGLVEAVASGALPGVRDWPFFPGAARELFPADWVVGTPTEAAQRILALTADAQVWSEATRAAAAYVLERWDWTVVRRAFEALFDYRKPAVAR